MSAKNQPPGEVHACVRLGGGVSEARNPVTEFRFQIIIKMYKTAIAVAALAATATAESTRERCK